VKSSRVCTQTHHQTKLSGKNPISNLNDKTKRSKIDLHRIVVEGSFIFCRAAKGREGEESNENKLNHVVPTLNAFILGFFSSALQATSFVVIYCHFKFHSSFPSPSPHHLKELSLDMGSKKKY
jgi:hypothetical protein